MPEELPSAPFTSLPWLRLRALMVEGVDGVVISPAVVSALCSGLTQLEQMHFVNCVSTLYDAHAHLADHLTKLLRLRRFTFDVEMGMEQEIGRNWRPASQPVLSKLLSALTALEALHLASDGVDAGIDLRVYTQLRHLSLDVVPVFTGGGVSNVPIEIDTCTLPPLLTSLALAGVTLKRSNPPSPSLMQQQQRQQQQQPPQQQPADGSRHLAPEAAGPSFLSNPVTSCISDAQLSLLPLPPGLNHLWISRCTWDASWLPLPGGAWTPQTVESLTAHLAAPASWPTPEPFVRALQQLPSLRSLAVIKQCHQCYKAWGMPGREDCTYHAPLLPASLGLTQLTSLGVMVRQPRQLEALATRLAQGRRLKQLWLSLVPYAHTGSAELAEGDWKDAVLKLGVLTSLESLWIGGCRHSTPIAASTLETWKEALALALPRLCVMPLDIECSWINWSGAPMCAAAPPVTRGSNGPRTAARAAAPSLRPYDWWSADAWGWS